MISLELLDALIEKETDEVRLWALLQQRWEMNTEGRARLNEYLDKCLNSYLKRQIMEPKICKECTHFVDVGMVYVCSRGSDRKVDVVTGAPLPRYCQIEREHGDCGIEGRFFDPKKPF